MNIQSNVIVESLEYFTKVVKTVTFKKGTTKYGKNDEHTSLKVIELAKNGFLVPAKIKTLTISEFPDMFDELVSATEKYNNVIHDFTGIEMIDDKNYRVREASILSFLILTDAMRSLIILNDLDKPINKLTLREYLYIYRSHLHLLNTESGTTNIKFALTICGDACKNLQEKLNKLSGKRGAYYNWFETLLVPMTIMGASSNITFESLINESINSVRKSYMVTGLGLYIMNILKSLNPQQQSTVDKAKYQRIVKNLNSIFNLHKYIITRITDSVNEPPTSLYLKYDGEDKSYTISLLELDLINFMLTLAYQYDEMLNDVKISLKILADFPRLDIQSILNRVSYL